MRYALAKKALLTFAITQAQTPVWAFYNITINTPAHNTPYASGRPIVLGGDYQYDSGDKVPQSLRIRCYDTDDMTVADESLATTFATSAPYGWSGGSHAPAGSPGQTETFRVRCRLLSATSVELGTDIPVILRVNGGEGS